MFKHVKIGDREVIEQMEMPEATKEVLREVLAQNRMILEANCMTMRLLGQPMAFISKGAEQPPCVGCKNYQDRTCHSAHQWKDFSCRVPAGGAADETMGRR